MKANIFWKCTEYSNLMKWVSSNLCRNQIRQSFILQGWRNPVRKSWAKRTSPNIWTVSNLTSGILLCLKNEKFPRESLKNKSVILPIRISIAVAIWIPIVSQKIKRLTKAKEMKIVLKSSIKIIMLMSCSKN